MNTAKQKMNNTKQEIENSIKQDYRNGDIPEIDQDKQSEVDIKAETEEAEKKFVLKVDLQQAISKARLHLNMIEFVSAVYETFNDQAELESFLKEFNKY